MSTKEIKARIKLRVAGGAATPAPPVGAALGQQGVNIMDFCKKFNAETASQKGEVLTVHITVYTDKKFDFVVKSAPTAELIKKKINITKGSSKPSKDVAGKISQQQIEEIAKAKMVDLNALDLEQAKKIVAGTARSMGISVTE